MRVSAKRLAVLPVALAATSLGWWGFQLSGPLAGALKLVWVFLYYVVFWGGWVAIPVCGVAAALGGPFLPRGLWRASRTGFAVWSLAWLGVLASLVWLGAPAPFMG